MLELLPRSPRVPLKSFEQGVTSLNLVSGRSLWSVDGGTEDGG